MDQKLSALTELGAKPSACDEIYIRDESEVPCCESKRIKPGNLLSFYDCFSATLTNKTLCTGTLSGTTTATGLIDINTVGVALDVQNTAEASTSCPIDNQVSIFRGPDRATDCCGFGLDFDKAHISLTNDNSAGNQAEFARITWRANDVTCSSKCGELLFSVVRANSLLSFLALSANTIVMNNDAADIDFRVESDCNPCILRTNAALDVAAIGGAAVSGKMLSVYGTLSFPQASVIETTCGDLTLASAGGDINMSADVLREVGTITGSAAANLTITANAFTSNSTARRLVFQTLDTVGNARVNVAVAVPTATETTPFFATRGCITTPLVGTLDEKFITFGWGACCTLVAYRNICICCTPTIQSASVGTFA